MHKDSFFKKYLESFSYAIEEIHYEKINSLIEILIQIKRKKSRVFILGLGGSAGNASHAVNDLRKLCDIQAMTPVDNVSEITATANDDGFNQIFVNYLKTSKIGNRDLILIFSVGGGSFERKSSLPIIEAIKFAKKKRCKIVSITGKNNGYASKNSNININFNINNKLFLTPISETLQSLIWHYLVSDPRLQVRKTFW